MKTIKDILERFDKHLQAGSFGYDGADIERHKQFITTEIKELLEGLKGKEKNMNVSGIKTLREMCENVGSNQRESKLRDDIDRAIK